MHTSADSIFYKNYILHYVNILPHLDHDLVIHNNKIECIKSNLHMKCKNFISGLYILARNHIHESILHADVFSNILHGVSQYLLKDNVYTLLYGTAVNPYYNMDVVKSFIINDALFMTISLPLKQHRATILSLYELFSYHLPTDMSDEKTLSSSYTKLHVSHPYLLLGMTNMHSKIKTLIGKLYNMIICTYNKNHSYCSEEQIRIVTSILLNTHLPRP